MRLTPDLAPRAGSRSGHTEHAQIVKKSRYGGDRRSKVARRSSRLEDHRNVSLARLGFGFYARAEGTFQDDDSALEGIADKIGLGV